MFLNWILDKNDGNSMIILNSLEFLTPKSIKHATYS